MEARKQWKQVILPTGLVFWFGGCHYHMLGLGLNLNFVGSFDPSIQQLPTARLLCPIAWILRFCKMERLRLAFLSSSAPVIIDEATVKSQKNYPKWWKPAGTSSEISFPPHWRKHPPLQTQADCFEMACTSPLAFAPARDRSAHGAMQATRSWPLFLGRHRAEGRTFTGTWGKFALWPSPLLE